MLNKEERMKLREIEKIESYLREYDKRDLIDKLLWIYARDDEWKKIILEKIKYYGK